MSSEFLSLCYHYIRPEKNIDIFPRLLGINISEFKKHINMLKNYYEFIDIDSTLNFFQKKSSLAKIGMLLTFDDGLSDHYVAAQVLYENGIKGTFFLPTCIIDEKLPANPIIIHYAIAKFGIATFLKEFNLLKKDYNLSEGFDLNYNSGDDVWKIISKIKTIFKYKLDYEISRQILLKIYENLILSKFPNALEIMHLTKNQIKEIINMGHTIGTHSHTHISLHGQKYSDKVFEKEILHPKKLLESMYNIKINSMSYPFGQPQDCFSGTELKSITNEYDLCFTVNDVLNTSETSPLEIGRYLPLSSDSTTILNKKLSNIVSSGK